MNRVLPRPALSLAKRAIKTAGAHKLYEAVSLYSAYAPEPMDPAPMDVEPMEPDVANPVPGDIDSATGADGSPTPGGGESLGGR